MLAYLMMIALQAAPDGPPPSANSTAPIEEVQIAPLFHQPFVCVEHPEGQLPYIGDALGTDCMVVGGEVSSSGGFYRLFKGDGSKNEDWYGWHAEVHAPFDGVVARVADNPVTNQPGHMGRPPAAMIAFRRADGIIVLYAHVTEARVKVGDKVTAGQVIAIDGNNGMARSPHIHVGAFKGDQPLQIRWDLRAMGKVPALAGN